MQLKKFSEIRRLRMKYNKVFLDFKSLKIYSFMNKAFMSTISTVETIYTSVRYEFEVEGQLSFKSISVRTKTHKW